MTRAAIARMACGRIAVEGFRRRRVPSRSDGHRLLLCDGSSVFEQFAHSSSLLFRIGLFTISLFLAMVLPLIDVALVLGKQNFGAN